MQALKREEAGVVRFRRRQATEDQKTVTHQPGRWLAPAVPTRMNFQPISFAAQHGRRHMSAFRAKVVSATGDIAILGGLRGAVVGGVAHFDCSGLGAYFQWEGSITAPLHHPLPSQAL